MKASNENTTHVPRTMADDIGLSADTALAHVNPAAADAAVRRMGLDDPAYRDDSLVVGQHQGKVE